MLYTLEKAAEAISEQLGWHMGAHKTLLTQMVDAANAGLLTVRHPHTDLPVRTDHVHIYIELVTPGDVNKWLAKSDGPWRWTDPALETQKPLSIAVSDCPEPATKLVAGPEAINTISHSTKTRRDTLTPVIELAQQKCRDPLDTAEVWAVLQVLAQKKTPPLIGETEDGLQYLKKGEAAIFTRKSLGKRLSGKAREGPRRPGKAREHSIF